MRRYSWLYLAAAVPFLLFALLGSEYGAFWIYSVPAIVCVVQFFFPSRIGWFLITALYATGAVLYTWSFAADLWRVTTGESTVLFFDPDDAIAFFVTLGVLYFFLLALVASPWFRRARQRAD